MISSDDDVIRRKKNSQALSPQTQSREIKLTEACIEQAIAWTIKLNFNTPTQNTQQDFEAWLAHSSANQLAWQRVNSVQDEFCNVTHQALNNESDELLPKHSKKSVNQLILKTLNIADQHRADSGLNRRQSLKLLSLCVIGITSGYLINKQTPWQRLLADVSTKYGDRRNFTLDDGTELTLNTDTAISIEFTDQQRLIVLRRGELFINTGKDSKASKTRDLLVQTPFGHVQPVGTRFIVRLNEYEAKVTVQQGAVKLAPTMGDKFAVNTVAAGETWLMSAQKNQRAPVQVISPTAWLDGSIAGDNMPLHLLLSELSRYRVGIIRCEENIKNLAISGVYHLHDSDKTLRFLSQSYAVNVRYFSRFLVMVSAKK